METPAIVPPTRIYRRSLPGADFSMEANTDSVPEEGHFYILNHGEVVFQSDEFPEALDAYRDLCREHWEEHLQSDTLEVRICSAWGLLGLEPSHSSAAAVIRDQGTDGDRKRLEQLRRRKQFSKPRGGAQFAKTG
ncbi:MAG: hypothetical protein ACK47B_24060 [Armatimonadota bacterium]